jgi:PKD repeat protein
MRTMWKRAARVATLALATALVVAWPAPAMARMAPETLADRRPVQAGPVEPGFPIDYLGVVWDLPGGHDHADEGAAPEPHGAVRFRHNGVWAPWNRLIEDGIEAEGQWASGLVAGDDAEAYQVRGIPAGAVDPQAVAINTTDGPFTQIGEERGGAAHAIDNARCKSRADWGADEDLRLDENGDEAWPPEFHDAQVMTVHHTATDNNDLDPESTVRAIYRYHAVDQGWGDIGYQYLIDESGVVYEGRWSGDTSASCENTTEADGSDFAHENTDLDGDGQTDELVTAAHTGGWNSGNLGVALLGEFTDHPRFGTDPKATAVDALEDLLAELALRHDLNPLEKVTFVNPVSAEEKTVETIGGHRDYTATECPGERLYDQLPTIRNNVAEKIGTSGGNDPPTASFTYTCSDLSCSFDGSGSQDSDGTISSYAWDFGDGTTGSGSTVSYAYPAGGTYTVTLVVTDDGGGTDSESATVTVDDEPASTVTVTGTDRGASSPLVVGKNTMTVTGSGFAAGASVALENGKGHTPTVTNVSFVDDGTLAVTVTVEKKGPTSWWDVQVTNPDGSAGACTSCAYVQR